MGNTGKEKPANASNYDLCADLKTKGFPVRPVFPVVFIFLKSIDVETRQVIAFYVGDHSIKSARKLWNRIPQEYREQATFHTDAWDAYNEVIPDAQHLVCAKGSGMTNTIERFNCTLRQRVSRLVRSTLSFSKSLKNHIGAIKYFICHYNLVVTGRC